MVLNEWPKDEGERILIVSFFEISPVGFTRRSCVYRRDAIRFQGLDAILGGWMDWLCGTDSTDRFRPSTVSHEV